jgi:oligopeptide transport system substrate-binding protein
MFMKLQKLMHSLARRGILLALLGTLLIFTGCGPVETRVEQGNREQVLHLANGTEPESIDPHIVTGVPEHNIITAVTEGLVSEDPKDLHPVPGMAERWDISEDASVYTFYLRQGAKWTNGDPVTAHDFIRSFKRILTPELAGEYAYMLFLMKGAEAFHNGKLDFSEVGAKALDDHTLEITLENAVPYFLSLLNHYTWFPVHTATIEQHGGLYDRSNPWTKPGKFVGNGPFKLKEWRLNDVLIVEKNADYWDADNVKLQGIHFYPMESAETQDRAFRAGRLHNTYEMIPAKIEQYQKESPELIHVDPYLGSYFYRINTTKKPFDDVRVRRALAMAIDRESIVKNVTRGGQMAANYFTPPQTAGYTTRARIAPGIEAAKQLLAEAGYPDGEGFPKTSIIFNTSENHRAIASAIQEMWRKHLNIEVQLNNQEWKVYLDTQRGLDYFISRAGWIGDYVDPNSFLDMWTSWSQQNQTGWSSKEYDQLIARAGATREVEARLELFQQAEEILMAEAPIIPIYIYTRVYLLDPGVKGWYPTILDHHPYKHLYLEPGL